MDAQHVYEKLLTNVSILTQEVSAIHGAAVFHPARLHGKLFTLNAWYIYEI